MISSGKEFIHKRICIFAGKTIDPNSDKQVEDLLRNKFNILLPQRTSMEESLSSAISSHEIIDLILEYRSTN